MAKVLAYETPFGTFEKIEDAEKKLMDMDMPVNMIMCVVI